MLELTDAGREWALKYAVQRDEQAFFRALGPGEQETLRGLLEKLLEDWKREEESAGRQAKETKTQIQETATQTKETKEQTQETVAQARETWMQTKETGAK